MSNLLRRTEELIRGLRRLPQDDGPTTDLSPPVLNSEPDLLEKFLSDDSIPAAVFRSHPLDRNFIFARDQAALAALTEADLALPVLFFGEAEQLAKLGLESLRAVLDFRQEFGPSVALRAVRGVVT